MTYDSRPVSASRLCSVLLVAALGLLPVLPPEHVHELTDAEGHQVLVAHRHVQLHGADVHPCGRRDTVDQADTVAIDLDSVYTATARYMPHVPCVASVLIVLPSPAGRSLVVARFSDELIHAPPRAPASPR